ncbi:AI-2E family transporter [Chitinimonas sp. JJ19]|uniref:AI-2E family transporter n=1 Tax=Chitinimonas sp. JJ19 TaxID=3109352 RepID=UPI003001A895
MKRRRPLKPTWTRYWPLGLGLAILVVLYLLAPVLAPFVTAAVLAYILEPLVGRLAARGWDRSMAVGVVLAGLLLALVALVLIVVPLFVQQLSALYGYVPELLAWLRDRVAPLLSQRLGLELSLDTESIKTWLTAHGAEAGQAFKAVLPSLTSGGLAVVGLLANLVLLPVVLFYFMRDWHVLIGHVRALIPVRLQATVTGLVAEVDDVLGEFLRGQISVMLLMAVFYSLGLWLCGVKSALPIGIIAGILVFIPYLGVIVGVLLATLAAGLQFQSLGGLLPVWGVFLMGQLLEGFVITPKLVGERIGLHPVAVIFALMAFGQLFGFVGVLLALPLAAALLVGLRHVRQQYLDSPLYLR